MDGRGAGEAEAVLTGFKEWRLQHPRATLSELEAALDGRLAVLRARLLEDAALASAGLIAGIAAALFAMSLALQYGLSRMPANRAIVILLFELVVAAVAAYLLAGETLRAQDWIGGALIVTASLASAWMERRARLSEA